MKIALIKMYYRTKTNLIKPRFLPKIYTISQPLTQFL